MKNPSLFIIIIFCITIHILCSDIMPSYCQENLTTASEYKQKYSKIKTSTITLPSGAVFKLKSIDKRSFYHFLKTLDISQAEYAALMEKDFDIMSPEETDKYISLWDSLMVASVENPQLSVKNEAGSLQVKMLTHEDIDKLQVEIARLVQGIISVPDAPLSSIPERPVAVNKSFTITDLLSAAEKYEGKDVNIKGKFSKELPDITLKGVRPSALIMQRFYLSDKKNSILVVRFCKDTDKVSFTPDVLTKLFAKPGGKVKEIHIRDGKFHTGLINEPIIISCGMGIKKIQKSWIEIMKHASKDNHYPVQP